LRPKHEKEPISAFLKQVFFALLRAVMGKNTMCKKDARQTTIRCLGRHFKYPQFMVILGNRTVYEVFKQSIHIIPDIIL